MAKKTVKEEEQEVIISQEEKIEAKSVDNLPKVKYFNQPEKQEPVQVGHTTRAFRSKQQ